MTLKEIDGDGNFEGRPNVGSVLPPGQYADFEVQYRWLSDQNDDAKYSNGTDTFVVHMHVDGHNNPSSSVEVTSGTDTSTGPQQ